MLHLSNIFQWFWPSKSKFSPWFQILPKICLIMGTNTDSSSRKVSETSAQMPTVCLRRRPGNVWYPPGHPVHVETTTSYKKVDHNRSYTTMWNIYSPRASLVHWAMEKKKLALFSLLCVSSGVLITYNVSRYSQNTILLGLIIGYIYINLGINLEMRIPQIS